MTFEQLNEAKVLILDLLGWGLSPENLVEAGISKQCLVPCLRELKLRLPKNIDLSDVVLFDPPPDVNSPSHSFLPFPSPNNDLDQGGFHRHTDDGDEMRGVHSSTPRRESYKGNGNYKRSGPPDNALVMHSEQPAPTADRAGVASLLDRLLPAAEGGGDNLQTASIAQGESHMDGPSADTMSSIRTDVPLVPPRGPRKQGKNPQGGRPAPVGRRKLQGHAVSLSVPHMPHKHSKPT